MSFFGAHYEAQRDAEFQHMMRDVAVSRWLIGSFEANVDIRLYTERNWQWGNTRDTLTASMGKKK